MVRYETLIGSFLGETAMRLAQLFAQARSQRCSFFFDDFDVIGKERGDQHETGEIKRVVSSSCFKSISCPPMCSSSPPPITANCWIALSGAAEGWK